MSSSKLSKKKLKPSQAITSFFKTPSKSIKNNNKNNKSTTPQPSVTKQRDLTPSTSKDVNEESINKKGKRKAIVIDSDSDDSEIEFLDPTTSTSTSSSESKLSAALTSSTSTSTLSRNAGLKVPDSGLKVPDSIEIEPPEEEEREQMAEKEEVLVPELASISDGLLINQVIEGDEEHARIEKIANEVQQIAMEVEELEGGNLRDGRDLDLDLDLDEGEEGQEFRSDYGSDWGDDEGERMLDEVEEEGEGEEEWKGEEEARSEAGEEDTTESKEEVDEDSQIMEREVLEILDGEEEESDDCMIVQGSSKDLVQSSSHSCPLCDKNLSKLSEKKRSLHVNVCLDGGDTSATTSGFTPRSTLFRTNFDSPLTSKATTSSSKPTSTLTSKPPISKSRQPLTSWLPSSTSATTSTSTSTSNPSSAVVKPLIKSISTSISISTSKPLPSLPNAFTAIMSVHTEEKQWKAAELSDQKRGRLPPGEKRSVPFYKRLDGMPEITVDAFKYGKIHGCVAYFLSHAHSDHYQNLSAGWKGGPVYCSQTTRNLIKLKLNVKDEYLKVLPMNITVPIPGTKATVTLIDANHCPGSTIFLFSGPHTDPSSYYTRTPSRIFHLLHCGDFRASPLHLTHPAMVGKKIDVCYLDTTYLNPRYCFPAQDLVIDACSELVRLRIEEGDESVLVGGNAAGLSAKSGEMLKGWLGKGKEVLKKEEGIDDEMEDRGQDVDEGDGGGGDEEDWNGGEIDEGDEEEKKVKKIEEEIDVVKSEAVVKAELEDENKKTVTTTGVGSKKEKMLVLVGTYSIGKERIVKGIAKALSTKVYCDDHKLKLLHAQDDPTLHALITRDPMAAQVALRDINQEAMSNYLAKYQRRANGFTKCIGLRPTGWTHKAEAGAQQIPTIHSVLQREGTRKISPARMYPQRDSTPTCMAFGVPYSEHSSFFELTAFALSLNYVKMIATVNVHTATSRKKMESWYEKWRVEKKRRADAGIPRMVPARSENYW